MKYSNIFNLDNDCKSYVPTLLSYIQGSQDQTYSGQKDLLTLIRQAKNIKKNRKKHKYPFLEKYLCLIENIVILIDDESLNKAIIDDFSLAQLYLVNYLSELIKMYINNSPIISYNKGIESIKYFIETQYGKSYFEIIDFISLNKNKKINTTYLQIMDNIYDTIINFHPSKLEDTLNIFILKENNNKLLIDNFEFKACANLQILKSLLKKASKDLFVLDKMKKYEKITRYGLFLEFKNHNEYLDSINSILTKNQKLTFSSLDIEPEDISFLKEKIQFLIKRGKNNELKLDKINEDFEKLNQDLKNAKEENHSINKSLSISYEKIANYEIKIQKYKIIDLCKRFEEYFFNIINHSTQTEILSKVYSNNNKTKIDLIVNALKSQYPKYIKNLETNDIDFISVIKYVNQFRLDIDINTNKNAFGSKEKLASLLMNYFKNGFNFKKTLGYMFQNFSELKEFIFDSNYRLKTNLYLFFCEKEKEA